ncbi:MAG: biotin transporter BioY [candidate division KSB1 bacterium]|nr:biotin transporter BioY [candidate division KSB1 bacterium]
MGWFVRMMVLSGLMTALTAVGAWLKIPFYPVPMTLQTLFTLLSGSLLPPKWAAASQCVYLLLGLLGLPVFAGGGGPHYLLQPTFGYLIGLPVLAYYSSRIFQRNLRFVSLTIALLGLQIIHLLFGSLWLKAVFDFIIHQKLGWDQALKAGTIFFFPSALIKAAAVSMLYPKLKQRMRQTIRIER